MAGESKADRRWGTGLCLPVAGGAVALADAMHGGSGPGAACYVVALAAFAGLLATPVLLTAVALGGWAGRRRKAVIFAFGVLLGAAFVAVNRRTFDGAAIRDHALRPAIMAAFFVVGIGAALVIPRFVVALLGRVGEAGRAIRLGSAATFLAAAAGLYALDARWLPGLYPGLHLQLALAVVGLTALGARLALGALGRSHRAVLIAGLVVAALAPLLRWHPDIHAWRADVATRSVNVRQWMTVPERLLDRITPLGAKPTIDATALLVRGAGGEAVAQELDQLLPGRRDRNLVIVSIDSLRADHVRANGYERATTPHLDALAERGLNFSRCYASYPTSSFSYSAFFTGRHASCSPAALELLDAPPALPLDLSLAGLLARNGWETVAESAFNRGTLARREVFGHLRDGFDVFNPDETRIAREGPQVTQSALDHLDRLRDQRFFLWLHYLEPHSPYAHHAEFDFGPSPLDRYDSEIAAADAELGRVLARLRELDLDDRTVVLVMSDHGEEFGEHQSRYHNTSVYDEQLRVPLVVAIPGLAPREVDRVTSLVDVLPTLLTLFHLDDPHRRTGEDLWPHLLGWRRGPGIAYAEVFASSTMLSGGKEMVVRDRDKLIHDTRYGTEEIYDLDADPGERHNRIDRIEPDEAPLLRGLRQAFLAEAAAVRATLLDAERPSRTETLARYRESFERIPGLAPDERGRELTSLMASIMGEPLDRRALRGPLREAALECIDLVFDPDDVDIAWGAMPMLDVMEDRRSLPLLQRLELSEPLLYLQGATLRGRLGDATAIEPLRALLAHDGTPDKHRVASALYHLDQEEVDPGYALAASRVEHPLAISRLVRGLGRAGRPELLGLVDEMLDEEAWQFARVRLEVAEALRSFPASPDRNRILARLTFDSEPAVVAAARDVLGDAGVLPDGLFAGAEAEVEAGVSLLHQHPTIAAEFLERARASYPEPYATLGLRLARVYQGLDRLEDARRTLEEHAARIAPTTEGGRELGCRLRHLEAPDVFEEASYPFSVVGADGDRRAAMRHLSFVRLTLENTGEHPWAGGEKAVRFDVHVHLSGETGARVEVGRAGIGGCDVGAGERVSVMVPFRCPSKGGAFSLEASLSIRLPNGETRALESVVDTGHRVVVVSVE